MTSTAWTAGKRGWAGACLHNLPCSGGAHAFPAACCLGGLLDCLDTSDLLINCVSSQAISVGSNPLLQPQHHGRSRAQAAAEFERGCGRLTRPAQHSDRGGAGDRNDTKNAHGRCIAYRGWSLYTTAPKPVDTGCPGLPNLLSHADPCTHVHASRFEAFPLHAHSCADREGFLLSPQLRAGCARRGCPHRPVHRREWRAGGAQPRLHSRREAWLRQATAPMVACCLQ